LNFNFNFNFNVIPSPPRTRKSAADPFDGMPDRERVGGASHAKLPTPLERLENQQAK
jgi:hypothetical protein